MDRSEVKAIVEELLAGSQKSEVGLISANVENFDPSDPVNLAEVLKFNVVSMSTWANVVKGWEQTQSERERLFEARMAERDKLFTVQLQGLSNAGIISAKKLDVPGVEDVAESSIMAEIARMEEELAALKAQVK